MSGEINVLSRTQTIVVDPVSSAVSIINAGPVGPQGPAGTVVDEVWIGPTAPIAQSIELWYDTSTGLLKVYTSPGSWVSFPYLKTSGGSMSGTLNMNSQKITNLAAPTVATDAARKQEVDAALPLAGGIMTGSLNMNMQPIYNAALPAYPDSVATKKYVDVIGGADRAASSGAWIYAHAYTSITTQANAARHWRGARFHTPVSFDQVAIDIMTPVVAGAIMRLAVYNQDANGIPTTLVSEAEIAVDVAGVRVFTLPAVVPPGTYWMGTCPTLESVQHRVCTTPLHSYRSSPFSGLPTNLAAGLTGWQQYFSTSANAGYKFPATFPTTNPDQTNVAQIAIMLIRAGPAAGLLPGLPEIPESELPQTKPGEKE